MASELHHRSQMDAWVAFRRLLALELPDHARRIRVLVQAGDATIDGEVASEAAKAWVARQVRSLPGVERVTNRLIVAAPLVPATSWDLFDDVPSPGPASPLPKELPREGTGIVRHPAIEADGDAVAGLPLRLSVDLRQEREGPTEADPIRFDELDPDWDSEKVEVEVHSSSLDFDSGSNRGAVVVRRGRESIPFVVAATVKANVTDDMIEVMAVFTHRGRFGGIARRRFAVARHLKASPSQSASVAVGDRASAPVRTPAGDVTPASEVVAATVGSFAASISAQAPTLTVKILRAVQGEDRLYVWNSTTPVAVGPANRTSQFRLDERGADFARRLRSEAICLRPGQHQVALGGFGQEIWDYAPRDFQDLYWALRGQVGSDFPIQFVTDEPHIPWELMQPIDEASGIEANHLFLDHPVARWIGSAEGHLWPYLPDGSIASFAPVYAESTYGLPFATDEAAWLCAELGAVPCEPERKVFLDLLRDGWDGAPVAAVHFAGHGNFDGATSSGILMNDDWVSSTEVASTHNRIGTRHRTLAVLNACDVGASGHSLGSMSGWAAALAKRRFGGFVAPMWPVLDSQASDIVRTIFGGLYRDGLTLGEAMLAGRSKGSGTSATPFAYVCYGDVMARVTQTA